jgi:multidrug efflux pump
VIAAGLGLVVLFPISRLLNALLSRFFRGFNVVFRWITEGYVRTVSGLLRVSILGLIVYGAMLYQTNELFSSTPTGFIPTQDKGYLLVNLRLPDSSSLERTEQVMQQIEAVTSQTEGVAHTLSITGQSLLMQANASNFGSMYVMLAPFPERSPRGLTSERIANQLQNALLSEVPDGLIDVVGAPPIDGL